MTTPATTNDRFAVLLRTSIADAGLSLDAVHRAVAERGHDVSITTLSYWRNGRSLPARATSLAALADLDDLLGLEPGDLLAAAEHDRRPRALPRPADIIASDAALAETMNELSLDLGLKWNDGLERFALHALLTVDANRSQVGHTVQQSVRAIRESVSRVPVAYGWDHPDVAGVVDVGPGLEVGRVLPAPDQRVAVAEVLLDPPMVLDETRQLSFTFSEGVSAPPVPSWEIGVMTAVKVLHLEIAFHPDALPSRVEAYSWTDGTLETVEMSLNAHRVSQVVLDAPRGTHGFRWTW